MIEDRVVELSKLMQSAALDPTRWQTALNAVNDFVEGAGVVLLCVQARQRFAPASEDLDEMMDDYFGSGWHMRDRREACLPLLKARGIVFDHDYQTVAEIEAGDYYHDFLARHRRKWFAGVGVDIDGDEWCLAFQRSPEDGAFDAGDMAKLKLVRGVLANAASLSKHTGDAWMAGMQHVLDLMGQPAILFDNDARVLKMNDAAVAILGPYVDKKRNVCLGGSQTTDVFNAMLRNALSPLGQLAGYVPAPTIQLGNKSYTCRATSLLGQERLIATSAAALVVIKPAGIDAANIMKTRYGLTDAETKVSLALAAGKSLEEVAFDHKVKVATVRAQIKSVFSKTAVNKQSKLVAFVRNLASEEA